MALKAGSSNDMANSLAKAIEDAFKQEWNAVMGGQPLSEDPNPQMRLLMVSVAQGVVRYLADNADAFRTTVKVGAHDPVEGTTTIDTI